MIYNNRPLLAAALAWCIGQLCKAAHAKFVLKNFTCRRFVGPGGMPSAHAAAVVALALTMGRQAGFQSAEFALSALLAAIVIYDAVTVRYQAGEHGKALNMLWSRFTGTDRSKPAAEPTFQEMLGHTPLQALAGGCLGAAVGLLMPLCR